MITSTATNNTIVKAVAKNIIATKRERAAGEKLGV